MSKAVIHFTGLFLVSWDLTSQVNIVPVPDVSDVFEYAQHWLAGQPRLFLQERPEATAKSAEAVIIVVLSNILKCIIIRKKAISDYLSG